VAVVACGTSWVITMNELRARFDSLDRVIVPDVWDEVQRRVAALDATTAHRPVVRVIPAPHSSTSQTRMGSRSTEQRRVWWVIAAALVAIALLAGALVAGGSRLLSLVAPSPTVAAPSPTVAAPSPTVAVPSPLHDGGPTNGLIAYTSNGQIFVSAPDGTNRRALTAIDEYAAKPGWSPDGDQIAFLSFSCAVGQPCDTKGSPGSLVVMSADGPGRLVLEENLHNVLTLEWSPDGKWLAFDAEDQRATQAGFPSRVWVVAPDGSESRRVADGQFPSWSPDGTTLAYVGENGTHLVAADGTGDRLLLQPGPAGSAIGGRWSPDGLQLAFVWHRACCPPANRASDPWLVDRSGNSAHRMSEVPDGGIFEGWSPDGRSIVYVDASQPDAAFAWPLVVAKSDGSGPRVVARVSSVPVHWSPDGTRLFLFEGQGDSPTRLVIIDPTGATPEMEVAADDASWQSIP
jgi:Tol biopolymer transport system component